LAIWPKIGPVVPAVLSPWFSPPFDRVAISTSANISTQIGTNVALYYPVWLPEACTVTKLWWQNGTAVAGTIDVGIYTDQQNRIVSTTPQTQTGTSVIQSVDITDTVIPAGLIYMAIASSSSSGQLWCTSAGVTPGSLSVVSGYRQLVSTLPNPATFATLVGVAPTYGVYKFGALVAPRTVL
jgi:hypothetical protein